VTGAWMAHRELGDKLSVMNVPVCAATNMYRSGVFMTGVRAGDVPHAAVCYLQKDFIVSSLWDGYIFDHKISRLYYSHS
jgi:hypothetical protein